MKSVLFGACLVLVMFGWKENSFAAQTDHDVIEEKKEVWFIPAVRVENALMAFSSGNYPATVTTTIDPYSAHKNKVAMDELAEQYPGYRIRMYALRLGSVKFRFVQAPEDSVSLSTSLGGSWQAKSYKKIQQEDVPEIHKFLKKDPGVDVEVIYTKSDRSIFVTPEIEYTFTAKYY